MEFRWVVFITLWTMLVGPVMDMPISAPKAQSSRPATSGTAKARAHR